MNFKAKTVLLLFAFFVSFTALAASPIWAAESKEHPTPTPYKEAAPIRTFKRITSTDQLISGRRYLIALVYDAEPLDAYVAKNIQNDGPLPAEHHSVDDQGEVELLDNECSFLLNEWGTGKDKGWLIQQQDSFYLRVNAEFTTDFFLEDEIVRDCIWVIANPSNGKFTINSLTRKRGFNGNTTEFTASTTANKLSLFQEVLDPATVSISSVGYATLYYGDRALTVPEGVVAKTYAVENGLLVNTKEYVAGDVIPQATAVVLKGKEGTYTFESATTKGVAPEKSDLYGYDTDQNTSVTNAKYYYKLSLDDEGANVGFYWGQDNGAAFTSGAHKAFLAVKEAIASKAFSFDKEVTAVKSVGLNPARDAVYSLAGVRMLPSRLPAGVYIKNGKKIIVK